MSKVKSTTKSKAPKLARTRKPIAPLDVYVEEQLSIRAENRSAPGAYTRAV